MSDEQNEQDRHQEATGVQSMDVGATLLCRAEAIPSLSWLTGTTGGAMAVTLTGGGHSPEPLPM